MDEDYENIVWDNSATRGNGSWDTYILREHKGNALEALIDSWLETGELWNRESDFLKVLELAGVTDAEYRDPDARFEKVYDTYLNIQNPFDTTTVDEGFLRSLESWWETQDQTAYGRESMEADWWDKNSMPVERWLDKARDDVANGTSHAWTSIPDAVTDYLKSQGYDGIKDRGGKNGGDEHTVYIPFAPEQIKSAETVTMDDDGNVIPIENRFDPNQRDIRYSLKLADSDYLDAVNRGDTDTAQKMVDEAAKAAGYTEKLYHGTPDFGFTKIDVGMSDDGVSFFATDSLETARTYSGADDVRRVNDKAMSDDEYEQIEAAYDDKARDFISLVNRAAGFYNFMEYDIDRFDEFRRSLINGTDSYNSVANELAEYVVEIADELYDNALYYDEELDEDTFYDREEIQAVFEASGELYHFLREFERYSDGEVGNYDLYANTNNLFELDAKGKSWNMIPFDEYDKNGFYPVVNTRQAAQYAKANGFDGVKITNVFDDGGRSVKHQSKPATVYIFFNPQEQVKSADPVTYDDNGSVIPLSERFNPKNEDIRYSRKLNREALQEMVDWKRAGLPYAPGYIPKPQPLPTVPLARTAELATRDALPYNPNAPKSIPQNPAQEDVSALNKELEAAREDLKLAQHRYHFAEGESVSTASEKLDEAEKRVAEIEKRLGYGSNTVGAAESNPDSYSALQNKHGTIKPGENPSRVVDVPKKDADGNVVSLFSRTGMESQHLPDELVEPMEQAIASGEFSHVVWSDKRAKRYAEGEVGKGFEHAWKQWRAVADGTKVATKDDIALGELLLANAMKDKQIDLAIQLTAELCAEATRAGQNVQAFRLLKKMTPEGQLFYLQKVTDKLNKQYEGRKGFDGIKLNEDYVKELTEATTKDAMDKAVDKIKQDIADQTPVTFEDKWNAWRYLAMLGNVRTQVRNIFGNAFFVPVVKTKNLIAAGIEKAAGKRLPDRTKAVLNPTKDQALLTYGRNDFENVKADVAGGNKYTDQQDILSKRRIFKLENIERARILTNDVMEWGDQIFSKGHYATSLASYMKANKLNPDTITPEQLNKARNYAIKEAQKATFRDANAFASFLNATKKNMAAKSRNADTMLGKVGWKAAEAVAEGIVPFTKTPANIMARGIEYSPVGLLWSLATDASKIKSGKMTAAEAIDGIAAGLTGTGLFALGCILASLGAVTGAGGDDKEDKYNAMLGEQNYALKIGDKSYTIDWLAPAALPFFTGVAIYEEFAGKGFELAQIFDAMSAIGEPLFELSMVQGIDSALGASKYSDQAPIISVLSNAALGYVGQAVPTSFGQVARAVDKTRRQTYYDPNYKGIVKEGLAVGQKQLAKTPASFLLEPSVDMWGREQENEGGSFVGRLAYNMLSPGYASGNKATAVDKELQSLYKKTGENSVLPSYADKSFELPKDNGGDKVKLNAKEYTEYAKAKGGKAYEIFDSVIGTKNWNSLSDAEKVEAAETIYKYANALAKTKVSDYTLTKMDEDGKVLKNKDDEVVYRDVCGKIQACEKAGIPAGVTIVAYIAQKDIEGDKDKDGDTIPLSASKNKKEAIDKMTPFINKKQRKLLYELFEVSEKVW